MAKKKEATKVAVPAKQAEEKTAPSTTGKREIKNKAVKIPTSQLDEEARTGKNPRSALAFLVRQATSVAVENGADGIDVGYKKENVKSKVEHSTRVRNELGPETAATEKGRSGVIWEADDSVIAPIKKLAAAAVVDISEGKYTEKVKSLLNAVLAARPVRERKAGTGKSKGPTNRQKAIDYAAFL